MEPWVDLPGGFDLDGWDKTHEVAANQRRRQETKWAFFQHAFDYVKDNRVAGNYLEFGCHRARTFRMAQSAARMENLDMSFWALDSFQGLPPGDGGAREDWTPGALTTTESEFRALVDAHGVAPAETVPGFYSVSLTHAVAQRVKAAGGACMVTIDCDLRESAEHVLDFLARGLLNDGAVVYLDDWFAGFKGHSDKGVQGAWRNWEQSRYRFTRFMDIGWWGRAFVASCRC